MHTPARHNDTAHGTPPVAKKPTLSSTPPASTAAYGLRASLHRGRTGVTLTTSPPVRSRPAVMLKGQATLLWQVLGEAHVLIGPSRNAANLEAAAHTTFLRTTATEGARGRWGKLCKSLLKAAKDRKARTFSEAMPSSVAAPGIGAFAYGAMYDDEAATKVPRGGADLSLIHI